MKRVLAALVLSGVLATPAFAALKPGDTAPAFTTQAALAGKDYRFDLKAELRKGPVVLYFFPAAFTPGCTLEANQFAEATADFKAAGATVIGVTAGNIDRVKEFSTVECRDKFAVAADAGAAIAKQYDSILGARPEWSSRTSYVIGQDGKIAFVHSDMRPDNHVRETLAAVKALKAKKG